MARHIGDKSSKSGLKVKFLPLNVFGSSISAKPQQSSHDIMQPTIYECIDVSYQLCLEELSSWILLDYLKQCIPFMLNSNKLPTKETREFIKHK